MKKSITRGRLFAFLVFTLLASLFWASPSIAADDPGGANVPVDRLESLKATLQDDTKRADLIKTIDALIAASQQQSGQEQATAGQLGRQLIDALGETRHVIDTVPPYINQLTSDADHLLSWLTDTWNDPARREAALTQLAWFLGIFGAGWLVEYGLWGLLSPIRQRLMKRSPPTLIEKATSGLERAVVELLPIVGFFAAAGSFGIIGGSVSELAAAGLTLALIYGSVRATLAVVRLVVAPRAPGLRLIPLTTPTAITLYRGFRRLVIAIAIAAFVVLGSRLIGLPTAAARLLFGISVVVVALMAIAFVMNQRATFSAWLHHRAHTSESFREIRPLLLIIGRIGHVLLIAAIIALAGVILLRISGGLAFVLVGFCGTVATLVVASIVFAAIDRGVARLRVTMGGADASLSARIVGPYLPVLRWLAKFLILALAFLALIQSWGGNAIAWLASGAGERLVGSGASILLILALAVVAWHFSSTSITQRLTALQESGEVAPRARTLLPLLRRVLFITIAFVVTMLVLSELGVAIAPLLAGAGVIGLAVGFGAQKLVQDVITGLFILLENAVAIGDVVNVAGIGGVVEDLSIRSIRLRDMSGSVHTIPFSSVDTVTNLTRDFSYYVLDIGIAYREDTDEVTEVCKQIVEEMRADPAFKVLILEPLEVMGVDQFADSAVIVKARIKTLPIKQWAVGREFNRRMKKRFDELGIEIPFPHQTIYFGVDKKGKAPPMFVQMEGTGGPDAPETAEPAPALTPASAPDSIPAPAPSSPVNELKGEELRDLIDRERRPSDLPE